MSNTICIVSAADLSIPTANAIRPVALAKGLQKSGFDVKLLVPKPSGKILYDLSNLDVYTVPITMGTTMGIYFFNQIVRAVLLTRKAKKIQKNTGTILQFEHSLLGGYAALAGCSDYVLEFRDETFKCLRYTEHPLSLILVKILRYIEGLSTKHATKIITTSNLQRASIINEFNVPEDKVEVIPPGYSESKIVSLKNMEEVEGRITFLGGLSEQIDFEKIIALARSLKDREASIYIIGDGLMRDFILKKIKEHNLHNVKLTGFLPEDEAYKLVAKSQVVVLPLRKTSRSDSAHSVKGGYYAALGKAIAIDDCDLGRDLKSNNAALVSDPTKPHEFIENVHTLLENKKLRDELSSNAREWAKDFTWEKQAKKLAKVYETLGCKKMLGDYEA